MCASIDELGVHRFRGMVILLTASACVTYLPVRPALHGIPRLHEVPRPDTLDISKRRSHLRGRQNSKGSGAAVKASGAAVKGSGGRNRSS